MGCLHQVHEGPLGQEPQEKNRAGTGFTFVQTAPKLRVEISLQGVKHMNGELVFLALVLLRIVMPVSILLSFGTWIERRNAVNA
jgi:hypothetical protein